ncbi:Transcription factor PIF3 [Bienertia sinuspersici]
MPLTELVRMFKGKVDVSQEGASTTIDPTSRLDTDCVELVWENGQIMMQGKAKKSPVQTVFKHLESGLKMVEMVIAQEWPNLGQ